MRTWTSHAERHKKIHAIQKNRQRRTAAAHRAINNQNQAFNGRFIFGRFSNFFSILFCPFSYFLSAHTINSQRIHTWNGFWPNEWNLLYRKSIELFVTIPYGKKKNCGLNMRLVCKFLFFSFPPINYILRIDFFL